MCLLLSRALRPTPLGLPVVVAGADLLVAIEARGHTKTLPAALLAEEHARLVVLGLGASPDALTWALCKISRKLSQNAQLLK